MKRWLKLIKTFAIGYSLICILLYFQQQRLFFFPSDRLKNNPASYELKYQDIWIPISETEKIHGWWMPANNPNAPVILYLHHNAVNISANITQAKQFQELGYSVFLPDYRGFGQSEGSFPTESQVYEDALIAWNYLTQNQTISPNNIIIYGHSIGGAVAIDLAAKQPEAAALIVQSSFTSMTDMTKRFGLYWLFPIELILRQRFDSIEKIEAIAMPVLIITGTEDLQIPVEMGRRLYEAAPTSKQLIIVEGQGHDNHLPKEYRLKVKQFIDRVNFRS